MPPRLYVDLPLSAGATLDLPAGAARHVQVLRLQPGGTVTLFNGRGGEWSARIERIGRSDVAVHVDAHDDVDREVPISVTIALGVPANDRMDTVVEKATELGVAVIQPLLCERSVLRLGGERAQKKVAHWQAVAVSACEQSGRTQVPRVDAVCTRAQWVLGLPRVVDAQRWMLSVRDSQTLPPPAFPPKRLLCLSGPEGGLTLAEENAARAAGFTPVTLGPRVLRADTAPLALLAHLGLSLPVRQ